MKNFIYVFVLGLILIVGGVSIYNILKPPVNNPPLKPTTYAETKEGIVLEKKYENNQIYVLTKNIKEDFSVKFKDIALSFKKNSFYINDELIAKNIFLNSKFALFYNKYLVFSGKSQVIIYNIFDNTSEIITSEENMFVTIPNNLDFYEKSFSYDISIVKEDKILVQNKMQDICNFEYPKSYIVQKKIEKIYDINMKKFSFEETISSLDFESYKKINKYC